MKRIAGILLMIIIGFLLANYLHWMAGFIACVLVVPFLKISSWQAFVIGFIAFFIIWAGFALWADTNNQQILSEQIGNLFNLPSIGLVIITGILGALPAGFLSWFVTSLNLKRKL